MFIASDSSVYEWFLEEGAIKGVRMTILWQGQERFGPADEKVTAALNGIADLGRSSA